MLEPKNSHRSTLPSRTWTNSVSHSHTSVQSIIFPTGRTPWRVEGTNGRSSLHLGSAVPNQTKWCPPCLWTLGIKDILNFLDLGDIKLLPTHPKACQSGASPSCSCKWYCSPLRRALNKLRPERGGRMWVRLWSVVHSSEPITRRCVAR